MIAAIHSPTLRRLGLLLMLCLATGPFLAVSADTVTLNDGRQIEGRIISEEGAEIIMDVNGMRARFYRDQVREIEREAADEIGPGEPLALEAIRLLDDGKVLEAWKKFLEMDEAEAEAWRRHVPRIQRNAKSLQQNALKALSDGEPAEAIEAASALAQAESRDLIERVYPGQNESLQNSLRTIVARARAALGAQARRENKIAEAERQLLAAVGLLTPEDEIYPQTYLDLGAVLGMKAFALLGAGDTEEGETALRQAERALVLARDAAEKGNSTVFREANGMIAELRQRGFSEVERQRPTATPTPTVTPLVITPTPTPTPTPEPGMVEKIFGGSITGKLESAIGQVLPESVDREKALGWVLFGLVFVVGYWMIPGAILKFRANKLDLHAADWRPRVKLLGVFALLGYLGVLTKDKLHLRLPGGKGGGKSKIEHPCPQCGHDLDEVFSYADLDFTSCPRCGTTIEPRFTMDDFIEILAGTMTEDAERVEKGAVNMESLINRDVMQKLIRATVTSALRKRASDLHIEPGDKGVILRHRIDGVMTEMVRLPRALTNPMVSAIKVMGTMDITEKRKPQDGSFTMVIDGHDIDIRAASSPAYGGEKVSLRLIDIRSIQVDFRQLGMTKSNREKFERAIGRPHGLLLVTGPTGSGKTTTLYVALQKLATGSKNIISLEDPIEFRLSGINQIQVNPAVGLTFASGMRSILRQDPDIIMVGEVRDEETAQIAVSAASTGHLVFSSLHTIDAPSSVARFMDLGVSPRQFCDALSLIVAQRLIRLVCPECKEPIEVDDGVLDELGILGREDSYEFVQGIGCQVCNGTGHYGRTGVFEMLEPTEALRAALEEGKLVTAQIRQIAMSGGMHTLRQEALLLLKQGMTSPEELIRTTK
ncbi:MAG: ATPase, T2SS/T4P/T4SS family [Sumerlaeia bacterium]